MASENSKKEGELTPERALVVLKEAETGIEAAPRNLQDIIRARSREVLRYVNVTLLPHSFGLGMFYLSTQLHPLLFFSGMISMGSGHYLFYAAYKRRLEVLKTSKQDDRERFYKFLGITANVRITEMAAQEAGYGKEFDAFFEARIREIKNQLRRALALKELPSGNEIQALPERSEED